MLGVALHLNTQLKNPTSLLNSGINHLANFAFQQFIKNIFYAEKLVLLDNKKSATLLE